MYSYEHNNNKLFIVSNQCYLQYFRNLYYTLWDGTMESPFLIYSIIKIERHL